MKVEINLYNNGKIVFENADSAQFIQNGSIIKIVIGDTADYIPVARIISIHTEP